QALLADGTADRISDAVKMVGISRGTYYKYKDALFPFSENNANRKAIITMVVQDKKGALSSILAMIANKNCNVLSINQTMPLNRITNVVLTLDVSELDVAIPEFLDLLKTISSVRKADLVAVE
ncbi:MAG: ACT domain-containing protein, partial [Erysipelotrichaceae bacterium]|nr:ACT domain-containing protein [Erysipelotrichaceae bacterium]